MVKHQPLQYYEPQLCLSCLTGIYGCRWKRYQRSHDDTTKVGSGPWKPSPGALNAREMLVENAGCFFFFVVFLWIVSCRSPQPVGDGADGHGLLVLVRASWGWVVWVWLNLSLFSLLVLGGSFFFLLNPPSFVCLLHLWPNIRNLHCFVRVEIPL